MPIAWLGDGLTDFIDRKAGAVVRLLPDGTHTHLADLPSGLVYQET